ncbi:uncharacterized protein LOC135121476 isoform X2 [Zophobas morio]|uniref:uncharacterized protein LOC135121476 isoform X2 n=1 Tax=Zophobas morio TaxID=2755281 RepID=UPI0030833F43
MRHNLCGTSSSLWASPLICTNKAVLSSRLSTFDVFKETNMTCNELPNYTNVHLLTSLKKSLSLQKNHYSYKEIKATHRKSSSCIVDISIVSTTSEYSLQADLIETTKLVNSTPLPVSSQTIAKVEKEVKKKSGYLRVRLQGKFWRKWPIFYCVLEDAKLKLYKNHKALSKRPIREIMLLAKTVEPIFQINKKYQFRLNSFDACSTYIFECPTATALLEWTCTLQKLCLPSVERASSCSPFFGSVYYFSSVSLIWLFLNKSPI